MHLYVYTAIMGTGQCDELRPPGFNDAGMTDVPLIHWVCFTDRPGVSVPGWEVRPPVWSHPDSPRRTARYHKLMAHEVLPDATYSLWMDGTHVLKSNPWWLVHDYLRTGDFALFKHPQRQCAYVEARECVKRKKDTPERLNAQVAAYLQAGFPARYGLWETSILLRRHTPRTQALNAAWWAELCAHSQRDQVSLPYVLWKMRLTPTIVPGCRDKSPFFTFHSHLRKP